MRARQVIDPIPRPDGEKTLPWRRLATYGTAVLLFTLGVLLLAAPHAIPALTVPGSDQMTDVDPMGSAVKRAAQL